MPAEGPKHTPGRWEVARNDWGICGVNQRLAGISEDEAHANARLIAASPALLAACEAACEHFAGTDAPLGQKLRDAIKAAKVEV